MVPGELKHLSERVHLDSEENFNLRLRFGLACIDRVQELLIDHDVIESLAVGHRFIDGQCSRKTLDEAASRARLAASRHVGSGSLDGSGSAAVSTSRGVAAALAGRALEASEYAVYAKVYAYASHAVTDLSTYEPEQNWQIRKFRELTEL